MKHHGRMRKGRGQIREAKEAYGPVDPRRRGTTSLARQADPSAGFARARGPAGCGASRMHSATFREILARSGEGAATGSRADSPHLEAGLEEAAAGGKIRSDAGAMRTPLAAAALPDAARQCPSCHGRGGAGKEVLLDSAGVPICWDRRSSPTCAVCCGAGRPGAQDAVGDRQLVIRTTPSARWRSREPGGAVGGLYVVGQRATPDLRASRLH
jgi:hypothetical protein